MKWIYRVPALDEMITQDLITSHPLPWPQVPTVHALHMHLLKFGVHVSPPGGAESRSCTLTTHVFS